MCKGSVDRRDTGVFEGRGQWNGWRRFFSTALDVCLARVITGAAGSAPVIQKVINRGAASWSVTMNGSGTVYLPFDPFIKTGRITASTITPHPTQISNISHGSGGWTGAAYWLGYPGVGDAQHGQLFRVGCWRGRAHHFE